MRLISIGILLLPVALAAQPHPEWCEANEAALQNAWTRLAGSNSHR